MKILFLPTARLTFDVKLAEKIFNESKQMLMAMENITPIIPDGLLTDPQMLTHFVKQSGLTADLILFQHTTFTDGEFIKGAVDLVDVPVIIWGVHEPTVGGRLRLNSLTGVMSTANFLANNKKSYLYTRGNPTDHELILNLKRQINVIRTIKKLKELKLGVVGEYPNGFYFSDANKTELKNTLGVDLKNYDLQKWFEEAQLVSEPDYQSELEFATQRIIGLKKEEATVKYLAQFVKIAKHYIKTDNLKAIAMRCWPDFFVELKTAPCGIFSQLTEQGFPTGCEADIHGSISMYILQVLTNGNAPFLGDVVNQIKEHNSIILWHCGFAPYSLANKQTGAQIGVHPNRKMRVVMDFGIKPGTVTIFRVSHGSKGYRFLITTGESLDVPNSYQGTSAEIRLNMDAECFIRSIVEEGFEPHLAMVHGDVSKELIEMARIFGIEAVIY